MWFVGASVGIAIALEDGNDGEQLMKAADIALYAAKNDGAGEREASIARCSSCWNSARSKRSLRVALQGTAILPRIPTAHRNRCDHWLRSPAAVAAPLCWDRAAGRVIPLAEADGLWERSADGC